MSDTPRTDALVAQTQHQHVCDQVDDMEHYMDMCGVLSRHARTLERELAEAKKAISNTHNRRIVQADCTLCAGKESPGFFTGCMVRDDPNFDNREGWVCDGRGHLARLEAPK